jgi:Ras-related protein Rab-8A
MQVDYIVKLLLVGDSGIGKSALLCKYCDDNFSPIFLSTIGIDFRLKMLEYNSKRIKVQVWDTAGQERFKSLTSAYYRGSHTAIVCYDITNANSFNHVESWIDDIRHRTSHIPEGLMFTIVGCKCDLTSSRVISYEQGRDLALKYRALFFETSAKDKINVEEIFYHTTDRIMKARIANKIEQQILIPQEVETNKCCTII